LNKDPLKVLVLYSLDVSLNSLSLRYNSHAIKFIIVGGYLGSNLGPPSPKWTRGVTPEVELLLCKHEALSFNTIPTKKNSIVHKIL
jgi:hypothetical protein